jgi:hypothetical protein
MRDHVPAVEVHPQQLKRGGGDQSGTVAAPAWRQSQTPVAACELHRHGLLSTMPVAACFGRPAGRRGGNGGAGSGGFSACAGGGLRGGGLGWHLALSKQSGRTYWRGRSWAQRCPPAFDAAASDRSLSFGLLPPMIPCESWGGRVRCAVAGKPNGGPNPTVPTGTGRTPTRAERQWRVS